MDFLVTCVSLVFSIGESTSLGDSDFLNALQTVKTKDAGLDPIYDVLDGIQHGLALLVGYDQVTVTQSAGPVRAFQHHAAHPQTGIEAVIGPGE
jgi:hypothetical protein